MPEDEMWTVRDGTKIAVGDMTEAHVRNALRMILRSRRLAIREFTRDSGATSFGDDDDDNEWMRVVYGRDGGGDQ